jgi:hypothetical protein
LQVRPGTSAAANKQRKDMAKGRMISYVIATQAAGSRLSAVELDEVRRTGTLPDWFFDEVEKQRRSRR